jgi:DNA-binding winged helix-turn-helix (wHTH) protein
MLPPPITSRLIHFGTFKVDLRTGEIHKNGFRIRLQEQPFQVLAMLLAHAGDLVTREELRRALWPTDTFVDFDQGLNKAINKIRTALGDSAEQPRYIETLPKRGYRLIVTVSLTNTDAEPPNGSERLLPGADARDGTGEPVGDCAAAAWFENWGLTVRGHEGPAIAQRLRRRWSGGCWN